MRLIPLLCGLLLFIGSPAGAGQKSVTFYLDGARVEHDAAAEKGYLEYQLPDSLTPGSLRVKPLGEGKVLRVELVPGAQDKRRKREIARLEEKKIQLQDRLDTLSKREEIFSAAAKSQSGKAPRKSRMNPDPLSSLQQGTDFAISQLDSIYRAQRSCQREIDAVDRKLAAARKGATVAKVWMTGAKAKVSYLMSDERWTPSYSFRWAGDASGELLLHAKLPQPEKGVLYLVSNGTVAEGAAAKAVRGSYPMLTRHPLILESGGRSEQRPLSFTFSRIEGALPPGEASAFWCGEYLGSGKFAGGGASQLLVGAP